MSQDEGARIILADQVTNTPPVPDPGTPQTLDLVNEIPGPDHFLIAQVLSGGPLGFGNQGLWTTASVRRGTTLTYFPGTVLHTLTSSTGDDYVLFNMNIGATAEFDPFVVDGLAGLSVPIGWSYSSELLSEAFTVTTPTGIATVAAVEDYWVWQRAVPEPATGVLLGLGLAVLARRRSRRANGRRRSLQADGACAVSFLLVLAACANDASATSFNLELRQRLPAEGPAARHVYLCEACTLAEFDAIPLPGPNWEKNATATSARLFLPDFEVNVPPVLDPSIPTELDLVPGIPGPDLFLVAKVLSFEIIAVDLVNLLPIIEAQVARGTTMTWNPGRVIHRITSDIGAEYVLFSIDETYSEGFELDVVGGMDGIPLGSGWTYTSELLTSPFVVDTPTGIASVITPGGAQTTWQRIDVPEPTVTALALAALGALARRRRPRRTRRGAGVA